MALSSLDGRQKSVHPRPSSTLKNSVKPTLFVTVFIAENVTYSAACVHLVEILQHIANRAHSLCVFIGDLNIEDGLIFIANST